MSKRIFCINLEIKPRLYFDLRSTNHQDTLQDCLTNIGTSLDYATLGIRVVHSDKPRDTSRRQTLGVMKRLFYMFCLYIVTGKQHCLQNCFTNTSTPLDYATPGILLVHLGKPRDTLRRQTLGVMKGLFYMF
jgi:hypothetical protein